MTMWPKVKQSVTTLSRPKSWGVFFFISLSLSVTYTHRENKADLVEEL